MACPAHPRSLARGVWALCDACRSFHRLPWRPLLGATCPAPQRCRARLDGDAGRGMRAAPRGRLLLTLLGPPLDAVRRARVLHASHAVPWRSRAPGGFCCCADILTRALPAFLTSSSLLLISASHNVCCFDGLWRGGARRARGADAFAHRRCLAVPPPRLLPVCRDGTLSNTPCLTPVCIPCVQLCV